MWNQSAIKHRACLTIAVFLSVLLSACANPQRDRYEEAYAAIEREEQRLIEQSQTRRNANVKTPANEDKPASNNSNVAIRAKAPLISTIPSNITDNVTSVSNQDNWWTQRYQTPSTGEFECLVFSKALATGIGEKATRVQLYLTETTVFMRADRPIERDAAPAGLRIDTNLPFAFERFLDESVVVIQDAYTSILNQLLTGSFVSVNAVFSSSSGVPNLQILEFNLEDFITAYADIDRCPA